MAARTDNRSKTSARKVQKVGYSVMSKYVYEFQFITFYNKDKAFNSIYMHHQIFAVPINANAN